MTRRRRADGGVDMRRLRALEAIVEELVELHALALVDGAPLPRLDRALARAKRLLKRRRAS